MRSEANLLITETGDHWCHVSTSVLLRQKEKLTSDEVIFGSKGDNEWELTAGNVRSTVYIVYTLELCPIEGCGCPRS